MKLKNIIDNSSYCSIGCITKPDDISTIEQYLLYNFNVISKFNKIIVALTKTDNITENELVEYSNVWTKLFGHNIVTVILKPNYGHTFGFVDLDNTVMEKSKEFGCSYTWKSTNDVLIKDTIFDVDIDDSTFLFLQGHGITGINGYYKGNTDLAVNSFKNNEYEHFFPQTNFFITSTQTDRLIESDVFFSLYTQYLNDTDIVINGSSTEYKYMIAEVVLKEFVYRNKLKSKHLIDTITYKKLLELIKQLNIADSSHKNILFDTCGICHYHYKDQVVYKI